MRRWSRRQCLILGDTEYGFSFPVKDTLEIFGMEIDNNLNFSKHISNFTKRIFYLTFIIAPLSGTFVERAMRVSLKL